MSITSAAATFVSVKWDSVRNILISKYSISFIPKDNMNVLMTVSIKYYDDVLKAITKFKKDDLIIDNRNLYK